MQLDFEIFITYFNSTYNLLLVSSGPQMKSSLPTCAPFSECFMNLNLPDDILENNSFLGMC